MDENTLKQWIKQDEAFRAYPYMDSTKHITIGWGRNLDNGIRPDEAELMFENDLQRAKQELEQFAWYNEQPQGVQDALINMNFNLGITELIEFKEMIAALENKNYVEAASQALNSLWSKQVGNRAQQVASLIREGK